jgi:ABC-type branched-subunit amino acid transport system substrate-binding protein
VVTGGAGQQDPGDSIEQIAIPPAPPRKWPRVAAAVAAVLAVTAATVVVVVARGDHSCATHGSKVGHECIGVSDGSYAFEDSLKPVMRKIRDANRRVERSGKPWVNIAYVEPISDARDQESVKYGIREELEGVYLAQQQLNDVQLGGHGDAPQIRLLVANAGLRSEQWQRLSTLLIGLSKDRSHPLVGVAGFGQSRDGTLDLVGALRAAKVPMMGATVTADGLTDRRDVGFFSVSPPNAGQVSAAVKYLKQRQDRAAGYRVMVIRDRNQQDIYNTSLYSDFAKDSAARRLSVTGGDLEYISGIDGVGNAMSAVADRVCDKAPDAVYFAGRGASIRDFIVAMSAPGRRCPVTVLTGDDAVGVYYDSSTAAATRRQFTHDWQLSRVTALYTALGHPALSGQVYTAAKNPYPSFQELYHQEFGGSGDGHLQDGQVILGHDAAWTLGVAIREAAGPNGAVQVTAGSTLNGLVGGNVVTGVSGPIQLGPDGNPQHKPMALVELEPDGRYAFRQVVTP